MPRRTTVRLVLLALVALATSATLADAQSAGRATAPLVTSGRRPDVGLPDIDIQVDRPSSRGNNKGKPSRWGEICGIENSIRDAKLCTTDAQCQTEFTCTRSECSTRRIHTKQISGLGRGFKGSFDVGVCVCFEADNENDGSNCLPRPGDITLCNGPGGKCYGGLCQPDLTDEGCPCGDQYTCNADPAANSCINADRPCICDGSGTCAVNYFPEGNACDGNFSNDCEVNRCLLNDDWYPDGDAITCQADPTATDGKLCLTDEPERLVPNTPAYCMGVGGICNDTNTCVIQPLPLGSPCGSDPTDCVIGSSPADIYNPCIHSSQPCVCDGYGGCQVNYLSECP